MAEPTQLDPFEQHLVQLVRQYTQPAASPVNPLETARAASVAFNRRSTRNTRSWPSSPRLRTILLVAAVGLVAVLGSVALVGVGRPQPPSGPARLVIVRDGDLYVSTVDGSSATMLRPGGADGERLGYLAALWSPDMRAIAAVRDAGGPVLTPVVDIIDPGGEPITTTEPGPGGMPSISWSPDGRQLAVASYPVEVQRDPTSVDQVPSKVRLQVIDLTGATREFALPEGVTSWTSADPAFWTVPEIGVRWSPDGRWIAVRWDDARAGQWHLVAADGSGVRELVEVTDARCPDPATLIDWFPDGGRLAVNGRGAGGGNTLCVETMAGTSTAPAGQVAATPEDPASDRHGNLGWPAVSPDGSRIASGDFLSDFAARRHMTMLHVYDVASGRETTLASGTQEFDPSAGDTSGWGATLDGTPVSMAGVEWTPDGQQVLYLSPSPDGRAGLWTIHRIAAAGGAPSVVASGVRSFDLGYAH